jgi:lipopolysaccharide/colanic/teichoic acid biosynthesis glycosyltransferase
MATRVISKQSGLRSTATKGTAPAKQVGLRSPEYTPVDASPKAKVHEYLCREILFSPLFLLSTMAYITAARFLRWAKAKSLDLGSILAALAKRTFDLVGGIVVLLLALPFFIVVPIMIKLESPGPAIFRQLRVGKNNRRKERRRPNFVLANTRRRKDRRREDLQGCPFMIYKFRTMREDAEKFCGPVWATKNDPRITKVGKILRLTRLDELPQLLNVLKGDMSLVGPRPERPHFVRQLAEEIEGYSERLKTKPGITGLAQVSQGYDTNIEDVDSKVKFDVTYIKNWSLWFDLKIIAKTFVVMLTGKGM